MKKSYIVLLLILPVVFAQINTFVNDYADILTDSEEAQISSVLRDIYDKNSAQFAIVIINSTKGLDITDVAFDLANGHLGTDDDNGLLLLVSIQDRQYVFQSGRGIEYILPDITLARIGRNYLEPRFKDGNYAEGLLDASYAIQDILIEEKPFDKRPDGLSTGITIFIILMIIAIMIIIAASKNSRPVYRKQDDYFTAAWILSQMMKGGKGGFSGGSSGGFGGFGKGSFGGGGARGRW